MKTNLDKFLFQNNQRLWVAIDLVLTLWFMYNLEQDGLYYKGMDVRGNKFKDHQLPRKTDCSR